MISVYQLTDALTASLFGMFALWAAASHRHWFVRTSIVGAALLVMLLIPAYEPLVEFTLEIVLVICGVTAWRRRRRIGTNATSVAKGDAGGFLRISLESMLLITTVVAVVIAVVARAPHISIFEWYECVYVGGGAGLIVLISVWIVCGETRLWLRLIALPVVIYWSAISVRWLAISRWMLQYWYTSPSSIRQIWKNILEQGFFSGVSYWAGSIGLGTLILCIWLLVVRQAGWFDPFREPDLAAQRSRQSNSWQFVAHCTACVLFIVVSSYSMWLFYLLLTPMPFPDLASPRPNGYDELLKAGRLIGEVDEHGGWPLWRMSEDQLREAVSKNAAAFQLTQAALGRECNFPLVRPWKAASVPPGDERRALYGLNNGLWAREMLASKEGSIENDVAVGLELLRLAIAEDRSNGIDEYQRYAVFVPNEYSVVNYLWHRRTKLDAQRCTNLSHELWELESSRVAWQTKVAHERIFVENSGWEPHLRAILDEWAGINRFENSHWIYLQSRTRMRLLIVALALRAFELENGRLPATLSELSPKYLPTIPEDPFDPSRPLNYLRTDSSYLLYSVGLNKVDDSQAAIAGRPTGTSDDLTEAIEFPLTSDPDQTSAGSVDDSVANPQL